MGAPVFNTNFVGQGTRTPKPELACKKGGIDGIYASYKDVEGKAQKIAEMGPGIYGAYQTMRAAYPIFRAGMQTLAGV